MRTAFSFWQLPVDEAAFFAFLRGTGKVVAVQARSLPRDEEHEFHSLAYFRRKPPGLLLLCREEDVSDLRFDTFQHEGASWRSLDPFRSPVLTYGRETPRKGTLSLSSLGGFWDYVDLRSGQKRKKATEFVRWARTAIQWMQARCTERIEMNGFPYAATPAVKAAVTEGKIVLRL